MSAPGSGYARFLELAKARKQTYEFSPRKVSPADIKRILECARWAPSCQNSQPWRFIIIGLTLVWQGRKLEREKKKNR